jgi:hypothetical protein
MIQGCALGGLSKVKAAAYMSKLLCTFLPYCTATNKEDVHGRDLRKPGY